MISEKLLQPFRAIFNSELIEEISKVAISKSFIKEDIIIDIGQNIEFVPLLIKGNIKVLREDKDGDELLLYLLKTGNTCAMSLTCCMAKSVSKIRAVADTDADVILIPKTAMLNWFHNNSNWRNFILQSYQLRFDEMLETIDTLAFMKMDARLYKYLTDKVLLTSKQILEITHQNISVDLHTSRVVISRLLKQLENEGKIKLGRHKIEVLNS